MKVLALIGGIVLFCALVALCAAVIHICGISAVDAIVAKVRNLHSSRREYKEWINRHPMEWSDGRWSRKCSPTCCYFPTPQPAKDFDHDESD